MVVHRGGARGIGIICPLFFDYYFLLISLFAGFGICLHLLYFLVDAVARV